MEEIKRIPNKIKINNYVITFSYKTIKGYYREQQRVIYATSEVLAKVNFELWANKQRTMTNVEILGIVENVNKSKTIDV